MKFCLQENLSKIPTRDDLDLTTLSNLQLVLVDHHVLQKKDSSLLPRIVEIIDHRQQSSLAKFPPDCRIKLELVGSCSSLVADKVLKEQYQVRFKFVLQFPKMNMGTLGQFIVESSIRCKGVAQGAAML